MATAHEGGAGLVLRDVSFAWPGQGAFRLDVPDLKLAGGTKAVLLGESGSGKSTLLSLVCGILAPERGEISVDGEDLARISGGARDRFRAERLGVIFQQFNLLPFATPLDNILLPLSFAVERRRRLSDPRAEALRLTSALGLPETLVTSGQAAKLSVGQQQRVAVARALIGGPRLIVADEPTSALDAGSRGAFIDLLLGQADAAGATLLMVTHDAGLAGYFDQALEMDGICRVTRATAA
ncbi:MAG: ATP-binding cassette domain-containing protein [Pseudomonadota bacterium]